MDKTSNNKLGKLTPYEQELPEYYYPQNKQKMRSVPKDFQFLPINTNPSSFDRFTSAFKAEPNLTKELVLYNSNISKDKYRSLKKYYNSIEAENPARTIPQKTGKFLGEAVADITDPIGAITALLTKQPATVALGGGLYEGTKSVLKDLNAEKDIDTKQALQRSLTGAIGARIGDRFGNRYFNDDVLSEILGRYAGSISGEAIENWISIPGN